MGGLFIEDLLPGLEVPGGAISAGLELTPAQFAARFGDLFWRPPGALDAVFFKLAAFCKTTAVSENSPANLGAKNVRFHRAPLSLEDAAHTAVLGRKFREAGATTGVCQVRSRVGPADFPTVTWTRECVVQGRPGWRYQGEAPHDSREKVAVAFDPASVEIAPRGGAEIPPGALAAGDFTVGQAVAGGRESVLRPEEIFWLTRGLGNQAKTHYTRDSGYIVWGLLTFLYGVVNYAAQLRACQLLGLDRAAHLAPVYLTEQLREETNPKSTEPAEFLSAVLTPREISDAPGNIGVKLIAADLHVFNHVNEIGRAEYARQGANKALANIDAQGRLLVGDYGLRLAVPTRREQQ